MVANEGLEKAEPSPPGPTALHGCGVNSIRRKHLQEHTYSLLFSLLLEEKEISYSMVGFEPATF